jgi:hypothetical protein
MVRKIERQDISPVIFSFFLHTGAGNIVLILFSLAQRASCNKVTSYLKMNYDELIVVYKEALLLVG